MSEIIGHPSESREQQDAQAILIAWLSPRLGDKEQLTPRVLRLPDGGTVQIDGVAGPSEAPRIVAEAFAHQGAMKAGQRRKVMDDAARLDLFPGARRILLFADPEAAAEFQPESGTWRALSLARRGMEIQVAEVPTELRDLIQRARVRQCR